MQWYYAEGNAQRGPVSFEELQQRVATGALRAQDLVWCASMGDQWCEAGRVPGLFGPPAPGGATARGGAIPEGDGVTPNEILMAQTRACLSGRWGTAVGAVLIVFLFGVLADLPGDLLQSLVKGGSLDMAPPALVFWSVCLGLLSFAVTQPLQFGGVLLALDIGRRAELVAASRVFDGFRRFAAVVVVGLLTTLYVLLWTLLLIIPGIVATYAYSMTLYILADRPDLRASDAIRLSKQCMDGYKSKLFGTGLSTWLRLTLPVASPLFGIEAIRRLQPTQSDEAAPWLGRGRHDLLHEAEEELPASRAGPAVEAECVFVQVVREASGAHRPLVGPKEPALEQGGDAVRESQVPAPGGGMDVAVGR